MIETSQHEGDPNDGLFFERLDAFMDKCLADIKAFSERESRSFEETRQYVAEWHARYIFQSRDPSESSDQQLSRGDRIRTILRDASRILESLAESSGAQSFILAVDPEDSEGSGFLGGSLTGREFWRHMRNGGEAGAKVFKAYCQREMPKSGSISEASPSVDAGDTSKHLEVGLKKVTAKNIKSELYEKIRTALRKESGIRNAEMKWTNPERLDTYGIRLVGWPDDVPAQNPSNLKQSQNKRLLQALQNGSLRFEKSTTPHGESNAKDYEMSGVIPTEESADVEEDFSWAYDANADIVPSTLEDSGPSFTQLIQHVDKSRSRFRFSPSISVEDPNLDYGDYLHMPTPEGYVGRDSRDAESPPIKRARTEEYESDL